MLSRSSQHATADLSTGDQRRGAHGLVFGSTDRNLCKIPHLRGAFSARITLKRIAWTVKGMKTPIIYDSGIGFTFEGATRMERSAPTRDETEKVSARHASERISVSLPSRREAPPEQYDYRDHLVEKSDVVAAWTVAIVLFFILTVVA